MSETSTIAKPAKKKTWNPSAGIQALLLLDAWVRLMIWSLALAPTLMILSRTRTARAISWDGLLNWSGAWAFCSTATNFVLLFNVFYVLALAAVRMILPTPQQGVYRMRGAPNRNLIVSGLMGILTKARHYPPFPGFLVSQVANIMPFRWLLGLRMGPRTKTSFFLDPLIIDPWGVTIGKNVNIGLGTAITAHFEQQGLLALAPVVIEDDVSIGAYSGISPGVHIKRGAILEPYSVVYPNAVIGESELWGGNPAHKKGASSVMSGAPVNV